MAAAVESRKRLASPFLDEVIPAPAHLAKRGRFAPCAGLGAAAVKAQRPSLVFDPLDALRRVFPDADPREIEACFVDSGRDINRTVGAYRARQAAASRLASAAARADGAGGVEECATVLVEQMAAAADAEDAKRRASWMHSVVRDAVAGRAAAWLREESAALMAQAVAMSEENAGLRAQTASSAAEAATLREENAALRERAAALERDGTVLKRGVATLHRRQEEMERAAAELKTKVAELEMTNYALCIRLRDADNCRFQGFRGPTCADQGTSDCSR